MFDPFGPPGPRISHLMAFFSFYHQPFENIEVRGSDLFILGSHDGKKKNERGTWGGGQEDSGTRKSLTGLQPPCQFGSLNCQFWANAFLSFEGLNIYMSLRSACWNSNLQYEGLKQQGFGKVSFASKALMDEISISFKEEQEAPLTLPTWEVTANKGCLWGGRFSEGTESACTFISNLLNFRRN